MTISGTCKRDFEKIGSAIFLYVQQLHSRAQNLSQHRVLLIGPLPDSTEESFLAEWQSLSSRPICQRAFRSTSELEHWRQRFKRTAVGVDPVLLPSDQNVQLPVGGFDLIALLDSDLKISPDTLTDLKRLLKRNGTLLLGSKTEATRRLRMWLATAGFQGIVARSDGRSGTSDPIEIDCLIARSDGRVSATVAVDIRSRETESIAVPLSEKRIPTPRAEVPIRTAQRTLGQPGASLSRDTVRQLIISLVEQMLQLPPDVLDTSSPFAEFGVDSIGGVVLVNELNRQLRLELKPTILFDYASVEKLATYISDQCRPESAETNEEREAKISEMKEQGLAAAQEHGVVAKSVAPIASVVRETDIAVIGMSGRFPGAENVQQFWENLLAGKNSISGAPSDRWDYRGATQANSLGTPSPKWGGFLSGAAEFDPLFFNISGREAEVTDPQHRLFLEETYHALEDAGYAGSSAQLAKKCGVFVGVEPGDYLHVLMELGDRNQNAPVFQGNAESILAARIAYFLDLKGPSIAINTACSSSLVAIHLACQSLIRGECDLALAGGVRVFASEKAYAALGNMGMLSPDGQCKTFDEQADGFVPGEAVGVLVLKPLSAALRDGDHIDGVIKGSAINQDGRTNGITAPSSLSQTQVELEVYEKFRLNPETFQYVEAHGTGTKLGDPIEIEALTAAFSKFTSNKSFCGIGSVKTNIGHTMAAAGVCSVIKVLLSLRHSKIPPSLNLQKVNPYIDFERSPFFVNAAVRDWPAVSGIPRRAAISSFGFSGTNSHLVLEEAPRKETPKGEATKPAYLVALSTKSEDTLHRQLQQLCEWLDKQGPTTNLEQISFTLNVGRGQFEHRCAFVVGCIEELHDALRRTVSGELANNIWRSTANHSDQSDATVLRTLAAALLKEIGSQQGGPNYREKLSALAALYVKGHDFDGTLLYSGEEHQRISLPTYPFARERYWITAAVEPDASGDYLGRPRQGRLHPLVHFNNSTPDRNEFVSSFDGSEFFLNEHRIRGLKILPGVAYLEMAIAAVRRLTNESRLSLKNVAWLRPLDCDKAKRVAIRLSRDGQEVRFGVWSGGGDILHAEGKAICGFDLPERREDLSLIRVRCAQVESPDQIYTRCAEAGLELGPAFRTIQEIWVGPDEALARLEVPARIKPAAVDFCLHPGLLDGALQTIAVLGRGQGLGLPVPFAVREVRFGELEGSCYAHVRRGTAENGLLRFDINLLNDLGHVLVELNGLAMRALAVESSVKDGEPIYVRPTWQKASFATMPPQLSGRLLLFDRDEDIANEIRRICPGLDVVPVVPGAFFQLLAVGFCIQSDSIEDFKKLLQTGPLDFVIYRWTTSSGDTREAIDRCISPLFNFVRALLLQGTNRPIQLLVPYQCAENPAYRALAGYARTLQQERPNVRLKVIESVVASASKFISEFQDQTRDTEVRYRDDERQVRRLELFIPEPLVELPLRDRGVYLISGGLGGLGRIFARYLAKAYHARLILVGRSEMTAERGTFLIELESLGGDPLYLPSDIAVRRDLETAIAEGRTRFGEIHGVIHAAGVIQDGFILHKEDFARVIRPKVFGAIALDELTTKDPLDFFVLFSSIAGVFGNVGQSDYAYANRFLDEFAHLREQRRHRNECAGVTVSIGWPAWRNGGMRSNEELELRKLSQIGLKALENEKGLSIFETALRAGEPEIIGLVGRKESVYSLIAPAEGRRTPQSGQPAKFVKNSVVSSRMRDETLGYLTSAFSELVKIPVSRIQPADPLEKFGVDSIMVMEFTQKLERDFGDLSKTLLFEHRNLSELTAYFLSSHAARLEALFSAGSSEVTRAEAEQSTPLQKRLPSASEERLTRVSIPVASNDIAIIGLFGRYPMADDLDQFWENLRSGRDCIVEIPSERWDYRLFYDSEPGKPGKTRNKWGGFLNGIDRFDAQFFNITPREAFALDPQERLFLETAWRTVEDAGYRKSALASKRVGVFVGVMYGEYQLYGAGNLEAGSVFPLSSSYASIANRVSYIFDWRGPSMAIDTMCSSSLTAIHLACESLRRGESELALAGGVNATLHPHKDMLLSPGGFAASDGRCRSFGEGGDGYVPGEGVGAVLLKPLAQAIADGDHVHAVIKASSLNHGGKTNGYTVPNPKAQAELILEAFTLGQVDPQTINYVEAHGTGTALGDPIEIAGMTKAFREAAASSLESHSCAVGSVKSNIGHLESAAGIAGVTKVLLQMKHGQIVPSLHSATPNPNISFAESIFYVPQTVEAWKPQARRNNRPVRRAGVSSFGAGGANAHVLIEEFDDEAPDASFGPVLFILSARNEDRLRARAEQLANYLSRASLHGASSRDVAYTLQIGREPFEERLAFVANDLVEAGATLARFLSGDASEGLYRGCAREGAEKLQPLLDGDEGDAFLETVIRQRKWSTLARFWVSGGQVEWEQLYEGVVVKRMVLPTYPFAGERYWAPEKLKALAQQSVANQFPMPIDRARDEPIGANPQDRESVESPELIFLRPTWQERAIAENNLPSHANLLLFDCDAGLQTDIQSRYPGWSVTRVAPGAEYVAGSGLITINPRSDEDFRRLVAATKPGLIIHRWTSEIGGLNEDLQIGVFALFHLCQALIDPPLRSTLRVLVCDGDLPDPARTAIAGFARAVAQEQPQMQLRVLQSSRIDARLLSELFAPEDELQIRWRNGTREVRLLEPIESQNLDPVTLRRRGVYLITGGLGGLGQIFGTYLARELKARLVLTGRRAPTDESRSAIVELEQLGAEVLYVQSDVGSAQDIDKLVRTAKERFGGLNGILHAAGVIRDAFLLKKSFAEFADVLRAKVHGTALLDEATRDEHLDFFALFSSTAGVFGNAGQIDYSYANAFLDAFAAAREKCRRAGQRYGKTFSINWPLWKETGMSVRSVHIEQRLKQIGLYPLSKDVGLSIFATALGGMESQIVPLFGIRQKMQRSLLGARETAEKIESEAALRINQTSLLERTETYLKGILAEVTQLPLAQLDSHQRFEEFGVDSIVVSDFNLRIEKELGPLPKTLLFEHANFRQLTRHLVEAFGPRLARFFANDAITEPANLDQPAKQIQTETDRTSLTSSRPNSSSAASEEIAIIGLAGRYPKANDIRAFWDVLRAGTDCVTEIPGDRWNIDRFFDPDPEKAAEGKMYARWGAFLDDVDKFDPLFFNIAPLEAELMDPQERLFLETAWIALEDAGYTRRDLARWVRREYATNVGVFVGVTSNSYAAVARDSGHGRAVPTTLPWSLANRVSYLFNFNGPSIPVDTACSSSLTAIHLACEAIRRGECQQAIAGGVNLYLHPSRYVSLCLTRMLSTDGKCRAFGEGGNGFVPGEGVGAVFLKPLSLALADRDHIYGVIKGSAINHGGRTNGYTVPNPIAQSDLIKRALRQANVEPRTLTYLEAHGTGTSLGDPIELAGLTKAFTEAGDEPEMTGSCALGSVKTNIGHLESAAGIAGLTKVLLQFKAGELVPSLHCEEVNPNITLEGTPFRLQRRLEPWSPSVVNDEIRPRRAGISSFGAGGANAHLIVEEFVSPVCRQRVDNETPVLIVLSARCEESLRQFAVSLARFLQGSIERETPIQSLAYTLQIGRESFEERIGFAVGNRDELIAKLHQIATWDLSGTIHGRVRRERVQIDAEAEEPEPDSAITDALRKGDLKELARLWVGGAVIDWRLLWSQTSSVRRINLPGYAFRRGHYWIEIATEQTGDAERPKLHPLIERRESTPTGSVYQSRLAGNEIVLRDHQISNNSVLPGAASLEVAMFAAVQVLSSPNVRLRNVVWLRPLVAKLDGLNTALHVLPDGGGRVAFELRDPDNQLAVQGKAERVDSLGSERLDLKEIRARCTASISPEEIYRAFANRQLRYGPGFQVLQNIRYGQDEVLAKLQVPIGWTDDAYRLHPALIDGALQSLAVLRSHEGGVELPFALESLQCKSALPQHCYAYCQVQGEEDAGRRFGIWLLNEDGEVLAQLTGLSMRRSESQRNEIVLCRPVWSLEPIEHPSRTFGKILLFDEEAHLASRIQRQGISVVRVVPADQYARDGTAIRIRRGRQEDYERVCQEVEFDAVIHAWSVQGAELEEGFERGPLSAHRLAKALIKSGKVVPWLYVYPHGEPVYEAIAGYAKSLQQEQPMLHLKTLAITDYNLDLVVELGDSRFEVRYRDDLREVRGLDELVIPSLPLEPGLRQGGVYLVTGGAGGLGRIFSDHLLRIFDARLVLVGRSELPRDRREKLGTNCIYVRADVSTVEGATRVISEAKRRFGGLNGIIHAAGELRDGLIRTKSEEDFLRVLSSKVRGAEMIDQVSCSEALDCFILFSSTAALLGNAGQADYAYANAYLDAFAWRREELRLNGQRSGRTLSINWPMWREGGMRASEAILRFQAEMAGLRPLETMEGLAAFDQIVSMREVQCAVLCGSPRRFLSRLEPKPDPRKSKASTTPVGIDASPPKAELLDRLKELVGKVLRLDPKVIENDADTSEYGFDSVTFTTLANELNAALGLEITPAVLFEYTTLQTFAEFLWREYSAQLNARIGLVTRTTVQEPAQSQTPISHREAEPVPENRIEIPRSLGDIAASELRETPKLTLQPIAVVGMSGIFPGSPNLEVFWRNLETGTDLISKPASERWSFPALRPGVHGAEKPIDPPWGGFMPGVDQFDSLFFDISPREAELMDPQQRLFLQTVWHTLEDAGYRKSDLAGTKTGLFVGVAANDYANLLATASVPIEAYSSTGNAHSVLANRVSFYFDWHGPSEAIDTACSSSLVAVHRAIESIASGSCDLAVVGGVNVLLSPGAFVAFDKAGMLCADGRCKAFDSRANGYVRGEGVGAVLLKPFDQALRDHDHIYGVIRGSAENHGGRARGLTVPNPNAQADLLQDAYSRAGIDPFTIGYIEAHGTGTSLGDPIEVNGLKKAFGPNRGEIPEPRCAVGSVKTNIGHLETAAGIAGIIKALLAMRHRRIPGNVHLTKLNPYIQVEGTPFYFPDKTVSWEPTVDRASRRLPRRAGVSSFGFGGANAHVLLEEFPRELDRTETSENSERPELFLFTARSAERLKQLVNEFIGYFRLLKSEETGLRRPTPRQIAFTLQTGREPLNERLAVIAPDIDRLIVQLEQFEKSDGADALAGNVSDAKGSLRLLREVHQDDQFLEPLIKGRELAKLARLWVGGLNIAWEKLWTGEEVTRVSLPGYPFEPHRFWIPNVVSGDGFDLSSTTGYRLHPLLHRNESTLKAQVYRSEFTGEELCFRDHRVAGQKVFPGAASLELALVGASFALETASVALRQVVWLRPVVGSKLVNVRLHLYPEANGPIRFELRNPEGEVHVSGKAESSDPFPREELDLVAIRSRCKEEVSTTELYRTFTERGLEYGVGFRVIQQIQCGHSEALSTLEVPSTWGHESFRLHPAIVDGAFQSLALIGSSVDRGVELPFAVEEVICPQPLPQRCLAFVRVRPSDNGERRSDIKLLNEEGQVLASISGLSCRRTQPGKAEPFFFTARWSPRELVRVDGVSKNGPLLLFDDQTELANALTRKDVPTVRVICGDCYQRSKDTITIRRENSADYTRLVHEVEFARVIHHWAHPTPTLDEALVSGVSSVHLLVQALLRAKKRTPITFLYPVGIPAFEAVGGYAKTLLQEQPDLRFKTIGIDTESVDLLLELENAELEVRYLAGRREVRSLEAAPVSNVDQPALRRGGVYLISGGAGGLGRIFARYLIERYDARVVLAGRLNLDEAVLQELRVLGRNAAYVSADISTGEGARKAVDYAKNSYGTINTVVHAAGVLRDGLIWSKTLEDFQAVLGPKVRGAEALDVATAQEPLDSFIVFSSMAGLLGNAGQSDYAYANAYLDAFAHRREELRSKRERSGRTLSINWPLWRGGGMSGTTETGRVAALELQPLEATQGLQLFESALASDWVQVWTGFGDGEKIRVRLLAGQEERRFRQPATGASTEQPRPGTSKTDLIAYLTTVFARVMRLDERQLKPAESLESYGFDSIMAVEFSQLLEKDFGELSQTLLFEYPTIESLAAHLIERASGRGEHVIERRDQAISTNGTTIARLDETAELCRRLELAPTDYLFVNPRRLAIQVLYYFENRLDFERMKTGLERVAKAFYPINSKLVSDGDRAYVIAESSDIPDFAEIVCDEAVSLPQQDEPVTFEPFRVTFDPLLAGEKLAKFRLIQLERGSLLNVNVSHAIADGYSYYYFLSAWAAASRSEPFQVPDHSRAMLESLAKAYREKRGDQFSESESEMDLTPVDPGFDPTTQRIETLHIDPESLLAKTREGADTETRVRLTENGVLAALVWQTYARSLPEDSGELTLACPIDFRRIIPELSPAFFGNASAPALIHLPIEEVRNASIGQLAVRISDAIRRCDATTFIRYSAMVDKLRTQRGLAAIDHMGLVDPRNGLIVTNVARFQLPPIDFGAGVFRREYTPTNYAGTGVIVSEGPRIKVRLAYPDLVAS